MPDPYADTDDSSDDPAVEMFIALLEADLAGGYDAADDDSVDPDDPLGAYDPLAE